MPPTRDEARARAREIARASLERGDALGWFERLYAEARGDDSRVPWADLEGHPLLLEWLARTRADRRGKRGLVVGCGLGEDAEQLARAGFETTGFDVAPTAIARCRERFPGTRVRYEVADLFAAPRAWQRAFDLVFEGYTLQALPQDLRQRACGSIAEFVAPHGELLVITRGRGEDEPLSELPWPLSRSELGLFAAAGLREIRFEDLPESGPAYMPSRHFRVLYARA